MRNEFLSDYQSRVAALVGSAPRSFFISTEAIPVIHGQLCGPDRKPLDRFCEVLQEEGLPFTLSDRLIRSMPDLELPKPEK